MTLKETISLVIRDFISITSSPQIQEELWAVRLIFIFFTFFFLITIIYFIFVSSFLKYRFLIDVRGFFDLKPASLKRIIRRWKKIEGRIETGSEYEYKLAIMEAQDLFNDLLIEKGFAGNSFIERVKRVKKIQLPNIEEVLSAHEMRNLVAHDPNYKLTKEEAKKTLDIFEKGIKNIESF